MQVFDKRCQALLMCEYRYSRAGKCFIGIYPWNSGKIFLNVLNNYVIDDATFEEVVSVLRKTKEQNTPPSRFKYIS